MRRLGTQGPEAAGKALRRGVAAVQQCAEREQEVGQAVERDRLFAAELETCQRPRQCASQGRAAASKLEQLHQLGALGGLEEISAAARAAGGSQRHLLPGAVV